jgi:hypothetical protein
MLILIFGGLAGVMSVGALLFCLRGFACAKRLLNSRQKSLNVFPMGSYRERRRSMPNLSGTSL